MTYEIDGLRFATLDEFSEEVGRNILPGVAWGQNLDAFNDVLRGGFGTPADGFYALKVMRDTNGAAEDVTDDEIRDAMKLLAETEGIFAETAGGVTVGVARKLIESGKIPRNGSAVLCVTGNGLKTLDAVQGHVGKPREIKPSLREFEALLAHEEKVNA